MRARPILVFALVLFLGLRLTTAGAHGAENATSAAVASTSAAPSPEQQPFGVAVIGLGPAAADVTWPVARAVYARASLLPAISNGQARVLAGETPPGDAAPLIELAELRSAAATDSVAGRAILSELCKRLRVRALVVVVAPAGNAPTEALLFRAEAAVVEATRYRADDGGRWDALVSSLQARFSPLPAVPVASSAAGKPSAPSGSSSILISPWFWAGLGAALVAGAVVFAVASSSSSSSPGVVRVEW